MMKRVIKNTREMKKRTLKLLPGHTEDLAGKYITDPFSFDEHRPSVKTELISLLTEVLYEQGMLTECERMVASFEDYLQYFQNEEEDLPAGTAALKTVFEDLRTLLHASSDDADAMQPAA